MTRKRLLAASLVALLALATAPALSGCTRVVTAPAAGEGTALGTVTMTGTGTSSAAPDQAEMSFGVETENADAGEALDAASRVGEDIADAVKDAGVDSDDIQTTDLSVWPQYDYDRGEIPEIIGYRASIRVAVTISDIEKVGDVIKAAADAGANSINGPSFTLSDDSPERTAAIEDAIGDARARAEAAADAAGESLGAVLSISEQGVSAPPIEYRYALEAADGDVGAAPPVEPGQVDLSAQVTVVFELK